ncbi:MAG: S1 RNA-binding domain-containing protein, partial [Symbiobacteriaceae bacterium]
SEVVQVGDVVRVRVIEVDLKRQRIGLSMKLGDPPAEEGPAASRRGPGAAGAPREGRRGGPQRRRPERELSLEEQVRRLQEKFKRL